jgi:hypothetical protein
MIRRADVKGENQHYEDLLDRYNALLTRNNNLTREAIIEDRARARDRGARDRARARDGARASPFKPGDKVTWENNGKLHEDRVKRVTASGNLVLRRRPNQIYAVKNFTLKKPDREQVVGRAAYNNGQSGTGAVQIPETPVEQASRLTEVINSGEAAESPIARVLKIIPAHLISQLDLQQVVDDALSHKSPAVSSKSIGGLPSERKSIGHPSAGHPSIQQASRKAQPNAPTGAVGARSAPPRHRHRETHEKTNPTAQYAQALQEEKERLRNEASQAASAQKAREYAVSQYLITKQ